MMEALRQNVNAAFRGINSVSDTVLADCQREFPKGKLVALWNGEREVCGIVEAVKRAKTTGNVVCVIRQDDEEFRSVILNTSFAE